MQKDVRSSRLIEGLAIAFAFAGVARAQDDDARLARIAADWRQRSVAMERVLYRVIGETTIPAGSTLDPLTNEPTDPPLPKADVKTKTRLELLLDFKSNRHRLQSSEETFNRYATTPPLVRTDASVSSFDGASLRTSIDRDKKDVGKLPRADISIVKGYVKNYSGFNHWTYPLFLGHAILGRSTPGGGDYFPGNLRPDRDVFKLRIERVAEFDGAKCLVLRGRAGQGDEIWVDPEKQSAIVRIAQFSEGKVAGDLSIRYQKTPVGYFPQGWKWTRFHEFLDGRIESIEEMHVERMQVDPKFAESEFTMKEMPGMLIVEAIQEAPADDHGRPRFVRSAWYRIDADGVRRKVNIPGE